MTWKELNEVYKYLKSIGQCHTQKDFAVIIGQSPENVSKKLGTPNTVQPKVVYKIKELYSEIFNEEWLLNGTGEMLKKATKVKEPATLEEKLDQLLKQNAELIAMLKDEQELNKRLVISIANEMADMKVALRQLASGQPVQHYSLERDDVNPVNLNDPLKNLK